MTIRSYEYIATVNLNGLEFIVDKTPEEDSIMDCISSEHHDVVDLEQRRTRGELDWFMLRVRGMLDGVEFSTAYMRYMLYDADSVDEVMDDGTVDSLIAEMVQKSMQSISELDLEDEHILH